MMIIPEPKLAEIETLSDEELARLYAEFADEDCEMAEAGLDDFVEILHSEDEL